MGTTSVNAGGWLRRLGNQNNNQQVTVACYGIIVNNNNNNERISRALFHVKHAQLR